MECQGLGEQKKEWVGYKVQVAETVEEAPVESGNRRRITLRRWRPSERRKVMKPGLNKSRVQAASGLAVPQEWYVDTAYVSGQVLREAELSGQQIWGPAQPAPCRGDRGFKSDQFWVEVEERRAICPAGKQSTQCSQLQVGQSGAVNYRFEWSWQCRDCEWTEGCVGRGQKHRTLVVGQYHTALQQRRQEMKTEAFRHRMQRRHGIEGTLSELIRAHGLRRARYRGYRKVALQNYLIGAASNIKRWLRRLAWQMQQTKRLALNTG